MSLVKDRYRGTPVYHLVFCRLLTAARHRGYVTYQELAKVMALPLKGSHMGRETGWVLGEIADDEHRAGRPLLSAVAVGVSGAPGPGFFKLAHDLGLLKAKDRDAEFAFWSAQKEAIYDLWKEPLETYAKQGP
jgi:hypothetical protein